MADTILLRFRDFSADTVAQHQALIARIGYTWWGWWKKSEEPDRTPDLERLKAQLETGGVEIGLFDKSDDRFYKAYVSECVFGKASVRVTSPMPRATPLYYRKEKLPGWFKITNFVSGLRSLDNGRSSEVNLNPRMLRTRTECDFSA